MNTHPFTFFDEPEIGQEYAMFGRSDTLRHMQNQLSTLVENCLLLSSESDHDKLLRHLLMAAKRICNADAATLYLNTPHQTLRFALRSRTDELPAFEIPLYDPDTGQANEQYVSTYVSLHNRSVAIDDVYEEEGFDLSGTRRFDQESGYHTVSMLTVPICPRGGEPIGVLQLINAVDTDGEISTFSERDQRYIEALASQAAVALDMRGLIASQDELIEGIVTVLAGAIDAKSAHTGGHCERVPELAMMLAEEASNCKDGSLADFSFSTDEQWREFRIGAWLHDCGKITTPEHIVDKATKLEMIHNRIHEIRMRFEVLRRDAEIVRLEALLAGEAKEKVDANFAATVQQLNDDFEFLAQCNIGGERLSQAAIDRLQQIGEGTWLRYFDDCLGLSHEELALRSGCDLAEVLPATERILSDKSHHLVARPSSRSLDPKYGFSVEIPEYLYNHGELYNLKIDRGTLTAEERFKINEHIMQTIVMLEEMPFPKNLNRVAEYAGTHHEKINGGGYPRKLSGNQLSVPARIMAIADIFEALTASDRPYKNAKTLSESIEILADLRDKNHIDSDLFNLFLKSGLHLKFGERFLKPEQLDEVDVSRYLGKQS